MKTACSTRAIQIYLLIMVWNYIVVLDTSSTTVKKGTPRIFPSDNRVESIDNIVGSAALVDDP